MLKFLMPLAFVGLMACSGMTIYDQMHFGLDAAHNVYLGYCAGHGGTDGCTQDNRKEAEHVYKLASQGVSDFEDGKITQTEVDDLLAKAMKVFADFQK